MVAGRNSSRAGSGGTGSRRNGVPALTALAVGLSSIACTATRTGQENLNAVAWMQTSAEYRGIAEQAYHQAAVSLREALADRSWTADPEQRGGYAGLPPAIILDVDETVLDNSPFQARLIQTGREYNAEQWAEWVREASAEPVPGALEFTRYAASEEVAVFYVTNRDSHLESATHANLIALGFPLSEEEDRLLTRGEREDWGSNKATRRAFVGERYRILMLVGDDLNDFVPADGVLVEQRSALAERHAEFWGTRWIVIPNPAYGSWERTLWGSDFDLSAAERLKRKQGALTTVPPPSP